MMDPTDKSLLQSKKAVVGLLVIEQLIVLAGVLAYFKFSEWGVLACILTAGFVAIGFLGGQSWQDRYVRAAIALRPLQGNAPITTSPEPVTFESDDA